jgi:hypothetical protein
MVQLHEPRILLTQTVNVRGHIRHRPIARVYALAKLIQMALN